MTHRLFTSFAVSKVFFPAILPVLLTLSLLSQMSSAYPVFARKYQTSCQTCHIAFPKMTAFGDAFRRNGYQFPAGTDDSATKAEMVSLGSEGNKRAWPDAVWPNQIPAAPPIAFFSFLGATYNAHTDPHFDFNTWEGNIATAGLLADDISFLAQAVVDGGGIDLERVFLQFDNLVGGENATLNMRFGKFDPGVFSFSNQRKIGPDFGMLSPENPLGANAWALETSQLGFEANGVLGGRIGYNVGVVQGLGNADFGPTKDMYVHAMYKLGGMRLDGRSGPASTGASKPWEDNSISIGGMYYSGAARLAPPESGSAVDDKFTMIGGDVNIWFGSLNVIAAFSKQHDNNPMGSTNDSIAERTNIMAEASYIVYPWFIPLVRFENVKVTGQSIATTKISPCIEFLVRANVRLGFETLISSVPSDDGTTSSMQFTSASIVGMFGI